MRSVCSKQLNHAGQLNNGFTIAKTDDWMGKNPGLKNERGSIYHQNVTKSLLSIIENNLAARLKKPACSKHPTERLEDMIAHNCPPRLLIEHGWCHRGTIDQAVIREVGIIRMDGTKSSLIGGIDRIEDGRKWVEPMHPLPLIETCPMLFKTPLQRRRKRIVFSIIAAPDRAVDRLSRGRGTIRDKFAKSRICLNLNAISRKLACKKTFCVVFQWV